ncbi:hypothetical protein SS1G_07095 [Paecilomyces variotii No. 5]|uniref:Rhodopsin domain-containing protein n=1 Tax=Byssochlamys spectabilis (strain No. 5 / NBRC 109023) TaxID=1356009 RepID=V5FMD5_BYSSN|nr:hypothetical protein SS1G_07095 [Paecilomyces variotii No. 5]
MASSITPEQIAYYKAHASDNLSPNEIATDVIGFVVAFTAVVLRVIARRRSRKQWGFGADDWMIVAAMLPLTGYTILMALSIANGEGRHIIFLKNPKAFVQEYVAAIVCYSVSVMLTKISILLYYYRLFQVVTLSWIIGVIVMAYNMAVIFVAGFQCIPLSSLWTGQPGTCIDTKLPFTILAVINTLTDIAILGLPVRYVVNLRMQATRKVQVLAIFLLGGVVCIFGIIRAVAVGTSKTVDETYNAVYEGIWSYSEMCVGVVAACLPTLGPLIRSGRSGNTGTSGLSLNFLTPSLRTWRMSMSRNRASASYEDKDGLKVHGWPSSQDGQQGFTSSVHANPSSYQVAKEEDSSDDDSGVNFTVYAPPDEESVPRAASPPLEIRVKRGVHQSFDHV